jgi:hypothetical protein
MLQCRVHKNRLLDWTPSRCDNSLLIQHKHKYCLARDELAIEVSQVMDAGSDHLARRCQPYPMVISSFTGLCAEANLVYACLMHTTTPFSSHLSEIFDIIKGQTFRGNLSLTAYHQIKTLPYFRTMGYSVGTAYAHENSGDTIASVMIGGISTVLNGAYQLHTGDKVMWYLTTGEKEMFAQDGRRVYVPDNPMALDEDGNIPPFSYKDVEKFVNDIKAASVRSNGNGNKRKLDDTKSRFQQNLIGVDLGNDSAKNEIALIKPFYHRNASDGDYERVFATCISPAGPFEMVDIMISRQSL